MRRDNRGMSLVEIIIVIAMITALTSLMLVSTSMISSRPAEKCAQKLVYSLEHHRTVAMGKKTASFKVYKTASGQIKAIETIDGGAPKEYMIGEKGVDVTWTDASGGVHDLPVEIVFQRGTGAVQAAVPGGAKCVKITASKAGKEYFVELQKLTGKVSMSK